jgi:hypothetical protein
MKRLEQKRGMRKDIITGNRRTAIRRARPRQVNGRRAARQVAECNPQGQRVEADQSTYGRKRLRTER